MILQDVKELTMRNNTMTAPGALSSAIYLGSAPAATNVDYSNNIITPGTYGLFSSDFGAGEGSLKNFAGMVRFSNVVIIGAPRSAYTIAQFVPTLSAAVATGAGANQSAVYAATAGVAIP
jgi:hypothetical protein